MSATVDIDIFRNYFSDCGLVEVGGRTFGVDVVDSQIDSKDNDYVKMGVKKIVQICRDPSLEVGDILFFIAKEYVFPTGCQVISFYYIHPRSFIILNFINKSVFWN